MCACRIRITEPSDEAVQPTPIERQHNEDRDDDAPFRFERRTCERIDVDALASMQRLSGRPFGRHQAVRLRDYSAGGLSAIADEAVEPGTVVSVNSALPACASRHGTILRCKPCGHGYELAVRFAMQQAA